MEKDRGIKIALAIITIIAVIAVGVAFASYSTALKIEGKGTVKAANWEVKFANLSAASLTGEASEVTRPTINTNDTSIGTYDVTFTNPGDAVSYTFDVVNNGTFDAEISSFNIADPVCTASQSENATTDASNVCNNLSYTLTYIDGSTISVGDELLSGETKSMKLTLTYGDIASELLPTNDVKISNLNVSIMYAQK